MKKVLKCLLWLIVILLVVLLAHPFWVSPLASGKSFYWFSKFEL